MNHDSEYERWLRIDPEPKIGQWVRSETGQIAIWVAVGAGLWTLFWLGLISMAY